MLAELRQVLRDYKKIRSKDAKGDLGLAWHCLENNVTYRLGQDVDRQPSIGFRVLVRSFRSMRTGGEHVHSREAEGGIAILDSDFSYEKLERDYVDRQSGARSAHFIAKTFLARRFKGQLSAQMLWLSFGLLQAFRCLLSSKNRANRALHITLVAEQAALIQLVNDLKVRELYDFAPYLIDSNWSYLLLKSLNVHYHKLPSPGPLRTHNHMLLCDHLILSSGYHEEELPHLPQVHYKTHTKWLPEWSFTYIDRYIPKAPAAPKFTIGFYSHGSWLRKAEGHRDDGLNIAEAEEELLRDLAAILDLDHRLRLVIFPHPREKREENLQKMRDHYSAFFDGKAFTFADFETPSTQSFDAADIGVAAFSTILYERLFCGYKTLIGNYGMADFPLSGSALEHICFNNRQRLQQQIEQFTPIDAIDFFAIPGLSRYRHSDYPYFHAS